MFLSKRHTKARFCHAWQSIGGWIAQLVEQRTENPCVPSSILGLATIFIFLSHLSSCADKFLKKVSLSN